MAATAYSSSQFSWKDGSVGKISYLELIIVLMCILIVETKYLSSW